MRQSSKKWKITNEEVVVVPRSTFQVNDSQVWNVMEILDDKFPQYFAQKRRSAIPSETQCFLQVLKSHDSLSCHSTKYSIDENIILGQS